MSSPPRRKVTLQALQEFRFELEPSESLSVTLLQGSAEVFGFELVPGQPHPFGDEVRAAVWSPNGAELEIVGKAETNYVATESPIPSYLSLHLSLARLRLVSRPSNPDRSLSLPDDEVPSPRVMVVGERGAGKTSLVKTLVNWRVREMTGSGKPGNTAIVVANLDVGEGGWTMPGTMSLVSMHALLPTTTPTAPLGTAISSGPPVPFPLPSGTNAEWKPSPSIDAYAPPVNPLVFWHGHTSPNVNPALYELLLKRVGKSLRQKMEMGGIDAWKAGYIVDTPGEWAEKRGMAVVSKAVRELEVNILLVVGNERLYVEMSKLMATNKTVTVVRVPKSDGASEPDLAYQSRVKDAQVRSYFYGGPALTQGVLSPFSIIVKFEDLRIFRVGEAADLQAPSSALPIGASRTVADTGLLPLDLLLPRTPSELIHRILAIPQADDDAGEEAIVACPVLGFVYVSAVDMVKKKVTLLSPLPGRLPRKTLLLASLDWQDS